MAATSRLSLPSLPSVRLASIVVSFWAAVHGAGVSAAEPIAPTFADVEPRADAEATYAASAYTIVHVGASDQVNEPGSTWRPVRGRVYRLSVEPDAYFQSLGRPDLARRYESRRAWGRTLVVGGFLAAAAGVVLVPWSLYKGRLPLAAAGGGLLVGGVVARSVGEWLARPDFPEDRAIDMAARYDEALRAHLGLAVGGRF
jgi:hypothetical protein